MELNATDMVNALDSVLRANLTPMIVGSPGIGKSDIVRSVADIHNLELIDVRLSQADPTDLNGFPTLQDAGQRMDYAPPKTFPLEEFDAIPEGKNGWLLFLDEINSAPPAIQAAAYKLVLDRQIGQHDLHSKVAVVCAGNKATDKAIVNRLSTAMQSRMVHLNLMVDSKAWLDWANVSDIDQRIISFIKFRPEILHKFDPSHSDDTFASPRTWDFASRLIKNKEEISHTLQAVLVGTVGEGPATEFRAFTNIYKELPTLEQLVNTPHTVSIPNEPGHQYAVTTLISHNIDEQNIDNLMVVTNKLPVEFQVVVLRDIFAIKPALKAHKAINDWIMENSDKLYG